jgi:hypothetical protein
MPSATRNRWTGLLVLLLLFPLQAIAAEDLTPTDAKALAETERQVTELKDSVYKAKARLRELEEAVLRGKINGSKALIDFDNQAEGFFSFSAAEFYLDDQLIQKVDGEGRKKPLDKIRVFDGAIPSGDHVLRAKILYRGSDRSIYTAFPYFKDHKFELTLNEKFGADYRKTTVVKLTALDKGYFKTDVKERLSLQVQTLNDWGSQPPE